MGKSSVIAALAAVGVIWSGAASADAIAFAKALQVGAPRALDEFIAANPHSKLVPDAMVLAAGAMIVAGNCGGGGGHHGYHG